MLLLTDIAKRYNNLRFTSMVHESFYLSTPSSAVISRFVFTNLRNSSLHPQESGGWSFAHDFQNISMCVCFLMLRDLETQMLYTFKKINQN